MLVKYVNAVKPCIFCVCVSAHSGMRELSLLDSDKWKAASCEEKLKSAEIVCRFKCTSGSSRLGFP